MKRLFWLVLAKVAEWFASRAITEEDVPPPVTPKKKRGLFRRMFGRKK